jgi:hypothetical protein
LEQEEDEWTTSLLKLQGCYNINVDKEDYPRKVNIAKTEIQRNIEGPGVELPFIGQPIKIKKVNIRTEKTPNLANVGDYWDVSTIDKITELLHEYQDLFPTKFTDMKGIEGPMGEMRIPLKPDARPFKQRPYRLNPKCKEKLKIELERMLEAGIIEPVEESKWISPMVVQDKKTGEIRICVDLRKLNDAYLHDPFPTPFTDEVLDNVGRHEVYSFTDGFSRYHQIQIAKEYRHKITFATEWGSYQYTVMSFGLKNAPTIFSRVVVEAFKEFLHKFLEAYFDYWIFFSLLQHHIECLRLMLDKCRQEFHMHVDAYSIVLGVVLAQPGDGDIEHPLSFSSRKLSTTDINYTTTEREGLAMVYVLQKFHHYLLGGHFKMFTDHFTLKYLVNKPVLGGRICIWLLLFQEYDFEIVVNLGRMNKGPNHLSRLEHGEEPTSLEDKLSDAQFLAIRKIDDHFTKIVQFLSTRMEPSEYTIT